jgi:chloramphenicol O-acetyltransferase
MKVVDYFVGELDPLTLPSVAMAERKALPFCAVAIWAMLQPIAALWAIALAFKDAAAMIWRNRK